MSPLTFLLVFFSVSMNAVAQLTLRKGMLLMGTLSFGNPVELALRAITNPWLWLGFTCFAASISTWLVVLSRLSVGVAYPMASLGYIIATVAGVIFLGESVSLVRTAGLLLICGGVFLISRTAT
jgi:multidrug transporter EmrE-like cation transporter